MQSHNGAKVLLFVGKGHSLFSFDEGNFREHPHNSVGVWVHTERPIFCWSGYMFFVGYVSMKCVCARACAGACVRVCSSVCVSVCTRLLERTDHKDIVR